MQPSPGDLLKVSTSWAGIYSPSTLRIVGDVSRDGIVMLICSPVMLSHERLYYYVIAADGQTGFMLSSKLKSV